MSNDIIEALNDPFVKIQIVFAYTGSQLSSHNIQTINDFLEELNDTSELAYFTDFNLNQAHKGLLGGIDGSPINVDITLSNWGQIEEPYNAIYGQISGVDLAHWWITYKRKLFSENIRNFLGSSDVNEEITNTIKNEPQNFIFYNNGITVLCDKIRKKPVGGSDKTIGAFICEGISIVNGAQTLGTIGSYFTSRLEEESPLKVFVKFISLENAPVGLAEKITIATNTQNKVDKKDFISLDSEQERLKTELALEGICYHYKRTDEKIILDENNYSLEEATLSLATFNPDVTLTVQAKREIGKLWEDRTRKPYTDLFNANLSATRLSRSILVYRKVLSSLRERIMASNGREKGIYIYGNLFIAHMVFQSIPQHILEDYSFDFTQYQENQVLSLISDMILLVKDKVEELYPNSMIPQMFRNFSKCRHIKSEIENL
ncbi:AIPR family protein [Phocaeicola vulgatus]